MIQEHCLIKLVETVTMRTISPWTWVKHILAVVTSSRWTENFLLISLMDC